VFLDTSAIVTILLAEEGWESAFTILRGGQRRYTGAHVRLECAIVVGTRLNIPLSEAEHFFDAFLAYNDIAVLSFTDELARVAVKAYQRYGKGLGFKSKLNFADCMSYAFAKEREIPLLHIGNDFAYTDIERA
jgi:ribonuclease VapC